MKSLNLKHAVYNPYNSYMYAPQLFDTLTEAREEIAMHKATMYLETKKVLIAKSTQEPETVVIDGKAVRLEVGIGATQGVGSDCYPYTVWGWEVSKGGQVTVYVTGDDAQALNIVPYGADPDYEYIITEPSTEVWAGPVKISNKNNRLWVGTRRYHWDPHF